MKTKILSAILAASFLLGVPAMSRAANVSQCKDPKTHKFIKCPAAFSSSSAVTASAAASVATPATATAKAQCRDAKGKFTKCPTTPAKPKQCRDAKGKFVKCPA